MSTPIKPKKYSARTVRSAAKAILDNYKFWAAHSLAGLVFELVYKIYTNPEPMNAANQDDLRSLIYGNAMEQARKIAKQ